MPKRLKRYFNVKKKKSKIYCSNIVSLTCILRSFRYMKTFRSLKQYGMCFERLCFKRPPQQKRNECKIYIYFCMLKGKMGIFQPLIYIISVSAQTPIVWQIHTNFPTPKGTSVCGCGLCGRQQDFIVRVLCSRVL